MQHHKKIQPHEKLIRSLFGFDTPLTPSEQLISDFKLEESEFNTIVNRFLKSFLISLYFRKQIFKAFSIFFALYLALTLINSLYYQMDYLLAIQNSIVKVVLGILVYVIVMPYTFYYSRILSSTRINILRNYNKNNLDK